MLLDTSGLLCLLHRDEPQYNDAVRLYTNAAKRFTHNYVLAEFVPLAQIRGLSRRLTLQFSEELV